MRWVFLVAAVSALLPMAAAEEEDAGAPHWSVAGECQMIVLPQKLALAVLPDLQERTTFAKGWTRLQSLVDAGQAQIVADLIGKSVGGKLMEAQSVEEQIYPTEFDPPALPNEVSKERILETLKAWPITAIMPTAFEKRDVGTMFTATVLVSQDGAWITAETTPQHVRLLTYDKYEAGVLANGNHLTVDQPRFHTIKSQLSVQMRAGERVLAGVHMLAGKEGMELFFLRFTVEKTGRTQ